MILFITYFASASEFVMFSVIALVIMFFLSDLFKIKYWVAYWFVILLFSIIITFYKLDFQLSSFPTIAGMVLFYLYILFTGISGIENLANKLNKIRKGEVSISNPQTVEGEEDMKGYDDPHLLRTEDIKFSKFERLQKLIRLRNLKS